MSPLHQDIYGSAQVQTGRKSGPTSHIRTLRPTKCMIRSYLVVRSKLPIVTGDFILPYFFQYEIYVAVFISISVLQLKLSHKEIKIRLMYVYTIL